MSSPGGRIFDRCDCDLEASQFYNEHEKSDSYGREHDQQADRQWLWFLNFFRHDNSSYYLENNFCVNCQYVSTQVEERVGRFAEFREGEGPAGAVGVACNLAPLQLHALRPAESEAAAV